MSTHRHFDRICCVVLAVTLLLTFAFVQAESLGIQKTPSVMGYETALFDTSKVHTIDIVMDDWETFLQNAMSEEYYACTVVIDGDAFQNVAIRGKGNTSLTQVASFGNDRYSFKIEFDHYDSANTYYGLDKLCLNNLIQDNTYMKDYLTYRLMNEMGVAAPLCSFVYISVNGEDWGLYLAVEGVEESFLQRNFGRDYGELYKPDSISMGGGRGNGGQFEMDDFFGAADAQDTASGDLNGARFTPGDLPQDMAPPSSGDFEPQGDAAPDEMPGDMPGNMPGGLQSGSDDVLLQYIDDAVASYANIFDSAKTDVTDADKTRLIAALKKLGSGEELESTVDVEAVIDYFVVHNFVVNFDSYTGTMIHNYYLYEKDGQMQMIPWDYNLAFGGFSSSQSAESLVNYPIDTPVSSGSVSDRPMLSWIFESEEYTAQYHEAFSAFVSQYFESGWFTQMLDDVSAMIAPYVEKDPTKFCTYEAFETGVSTLKTFCLLRAESIRGQLDGTIGASADTQQSDTLIDAGDLQISDMGAMNQSMGGAMQMPAGEGGMDSEASWQAPPDAAAGSDAEGAAEQTPPQMPDGGMDGGAPPDFPGNSQQGFSGAPDEMAQGTVRGQATSSYAAQIWLAACAAILLLGIGFALLYQRRRGSQKKPRIARSRRREGM